MANKKTFDREKMYRKIMPTYYDNNFALASDDTDSFEEDVPFEDATSEYEENTVVDFPLRHTSKPAVPAFPENEEQLEEEEPESSITFGGFTDKMNSTILRAREMERIREQHSSIAIFNLTEKVIMEKLDMVMESMNCCKCDRCKMDVVALTLNNMDPYYVVRAANSPDYSKLEKEISDKATKVVLKSALKVRKNPRH